MMYVLVMRETTTFAINIEAGSLEEAQAALALVDGHEECWTSKAQYALWGEPQECEQLFTIEDGAGNECSGSGS